MPPYNASNDEATGFAGRERPPTVPAGGDGEERAVPGYDDVSQTDYPTIRSPHGGDPLAFLLDIAETVERRQEPEPALVLTVAPGGG